MNQPPRADWRFLLASPWNFLAMGCGSGLSPVAPGTAGSLFGWATWLLLQGVLPGWAWPPLLLAGFAGGVWICERAARALGLHDPAPLVWDEVVAMWLVLWAAQWGLNALTGGHGLLPWPLQLAGFALFRLFDAVKPGPVGWADRKLSGGLGIMLDDIVAAVLSLLGLAVGLLAWTFIDMWLHGIRVPT
ncbi:MAG: phosphatidylglycerophosphatase A [Betaproteobacteria bacterium]|uniref:phosphatidylglycerophosphatase A family protein n=1 Tax=Thiomonas sp. FB-6 TaxID=1158291 RepID=UPI0003794115|nr:phosphatidylglycerophosphatase A [Thiomonas sp. FB-6]MBU6438682.1 phosphatidylglycerophosphatase A [Betaproteobacteria bacterium]MBU6511915.1 phosphatidylglycerophosphatase A [Betaproteobacteria bacterium]MDE1954145.1 phosphatidylglycerophosphatase A [Betaproteobacteria bacterium]MDE2152276.1 phosphatidylglycerophosphatase A [Betaproteobacteria bacterium]MDE2477568.1 phosphatidylglycerophosphatase A [Betaproteobacteria bacterium]